MSRNVLMVCGALTLLGGCGGEDKQGPMSGEDFCGTWAKAACSTQTVAACQAASVDACRASQRDACLELVGDDFMDNDAQACLVAVERAYRDADLTSSELQVVLQLQNDCDRVISGSGDEGDECMLDRDCDRSGDLECVIKGGDNVGTCQIPEEIEAGRDCSNPQDVCEDGFYCAMNMDYCIAQGSEDDDCTTSDECEDTTFCNADGVCEAKRAVDSDCTASEQCLSGVCYEFVDGEQVCIDRLRLSRSEPICRDLR